MTTSHLLLRSPLPLATTPTQLQEWCLDPSHRQTCVASLHPNPHLRPNTVLCFCWTIIHASPPTLPPSSSRCCRLCLWVVPPPSVWTSGLCLNPFPSFIIPNILR